jgi:hypothetical protein
MPSWYAVSVARRVELLVRLEFTDGVYTGGAVRTGRRTAKGAVVGGHDLAVVHPEVCSVAPLRVPRSTGAPGRQHDMKGAPESESHTAQQ